MRGRSALEGIKRPAKSFAKVCGFSNERDLRLESLRRGVRAGFEAVDRGEFSDYDASNITKLADRVKARGRKRLAEEANTPAR